MPFHTISGADAREEKVWVLRMRCMPNFFVEEGIDNVCFNVGGGQKASMCPR